MTSTAEYDTLIVGTDAARKCLLEMVPDGQMRDWKQHVSNSAQRIYRRIPFAAENSLPHVWILGGADAKLN